jgi:hypothetical protein
MLAYAPPAARAGLALVVVILLPDPSMAQQRFEFGASLAAVEVYDDNLFSSPEAPEPDNIWRLSPRLSFGRRSPRLTLRGRYGLDAEWFRNHPSLDTPLAGQDASFEMSWAPSQRVVASTTASYVETHAPGELTILTGLELGRVRARRLSAKQSFSWQMGARTKGAIEQTFMREEVAGFPRMDTQVASVRLERRLGALDVGHLGYTARRFDSGVDVMLSHVVTLGWIREITPRDHFEIEVGPRLSERALGAEVTASLRHKFARGEAGLSYVQTQTTVLGQTGPVITKGVTAMFRQQLLPSLTVAGGPTFARVTGRGSEFDVYRFNLEMAWRLTRRLSLSASHQFNFQSGVPGLARPDAEIVHNTFMLRAVAASSRN